MIYEQYFKSANAQHVTFQKAFYMLACLLDISKEEAYNKLLEECQPYRY